MYTISNIYNTIVTQDEELNILINGIPFVVIMYGSYRHLKNGLSFWPTLYIVVHT